MRGDGEERLEALPHGREIQRLPSACKSSFCIKQNGRLRRKKEGSEIEMDPAPRSHGVSPSLVTISPSIDLPTYISRHSRSEPIQEHPLRICGATAAVPHMTHLRCHYYYVDDYHRHNQAFLISRGPQRSSVAGRVLQKA